MTTTAQFATAIVASFPAYDVVRRDTYTVNTDAGPVEGVTFIDAADRLCFGRKTRNHGVIYSEYSAGSVVSYAMECNVCPVEAVDKARERGHALHWINACGASLVSHNRAKWTMVELTEGMVVFFEGRLFTIQKAPNDNLRFQPYAA